MLTALVLLLGHPHSAPTMWIDVAIESGSVEMTVSVRADHAGPWLQGGLPPEELVDFITDEERKIALDTLTQYFGAHNPVRIDGERVRPLAITIGAPEDADGREMIGFVAFRLHYRCEGWPDLVQIEWEDYEGANFQNETIIPGTLRVGPQFESLAFSPEKPKFAWKIPESGLPERPRIAAIPAAPLPADYTWIAHAVLGAAALGGVLGLLRAGAPVRSWALLLLLLGGAEAAVPWKSTPAPVLTRPQARDVFEQLLRNVYRAFEAVTEEESYDLLSYSVEPELARKLYLDIRRGLEMREQGGAIAEVGSVERRGGTVEFTGAREFRADWCWRVFAHITHWGHTHARINEYRARFLVRAGPMGWRIEEFQLQDMQRIPTEDDPQ